MQVTEKLKNEFAPTGTLRVALNHGNRILVGRNEDQTPFGISVELARQLATWLDLPFSFVDYERAVEVSSSATDGLWDVCFLAVDPKRAEVLDFTAPYVRIEGRYLASAACGALNAEELVRSGAKVGTVDGSAYTLTLMRKPGAENLVVYPNISTALAALDAGQIKALAGIGDVMAAEAALRPGARDLRPPFMEILQAMAIVKGRPMAADALRSFLADLAQSDGVGDILEQFDVSRDCAVVPD